jgi:hypothetical protein
MHFNNDGLQSHHGRAAGIAPMIEQARSVVEASRKENPLLVKIQQLVPQSFSQTEHIGLFCSIKTTTLTVSCSGLGIGRRP